MKFKDMEKVMSQMDIIDQNYMFNMFDTVEEVSKTCREGNGLTYHYCSLDVCKSIIEKQCIWASDMRFMNDNKEFIYGIDIVKKGLSKLKKYVQYQDISKILLDKINEIDLNNITQRFLACFSLNGDLRNQWKKYGSKGNGVSIGFAPMDVLIELKPRPFSFFVLYKKKEQMNDCVKQLNRSFDFYNENNSDVIINSILHYITYLIPKYKSKKFSSENEYRYIFPNYNPKASYSPKIKHRVNNNFTLVKPYIELKTVGKFDKENNQELDPNSKNLVIKEIIVGNKLDFKLTKIGLESLLITNGYNLNDIVIRKSKRHFIN